MPKLSIRRFWPLSILFSLMVVLAATEAAQGSPPQPEQTIEELVNALDSPDLLVRSRALTSLVQDKKEPRSLKFAIAAMKDPNWYNRMNAARLLGVLKDPGAIDALGGALGDEKWNVREIATEALGMIGGPRSAEILLSAIKSPFPDVKVRASNILTLVKFPDALLVFKKALADENPSVRLMAALAIQTTDPEQLGPLTMLLEDPEPAIRVKAAFYLKQLKTKN